MQLFRDSKGRDWSVTINGLAVKRAKALKIDIGSLLNGGNFSELDRLVNDLALFVDLLYLLCRDEAIARSVTEEDFFAALDGDAFEGAIRAFTLELIDFFRDPEIRKQMRDLHEKTLRAKNFAKAEARKQLDQFDPEKAMEEQIRKIREKAAKQSTSND